MRDARKQIVKALVTAINTKITGVPVFTKVNRPVEGVNAVYPYIYISDIYMTESGSKRFAIYDYELLIQVVHKDLKSMVALWDHMNSLAGLVTTKRDLTLTDTFTVMLMRLLSTSEQEVNTDNGVLNIGLVRFSIKVEDTLS